MALLWPISRGSRTVPPSINSNARDPPWPRCASNAPRRRRAPSPACTQPMGGLRESCTALAAELEFGGSSVPHDPHTKAAAVMSRGQPTVVHVTIVSPLASEVLSPVRSLAGSALRRAGALYMCEAGAGLL